MASSYKLLPAIDFNGQPILRMRVTVDYEVIVDTKNVGQLRETVASGREGPDHLTQDDLQDWAIVVEELSSLLGRMSAADPVVWSGLESPEKRLPTPQAADIVRKFGRNVGDILRFIPHPSGTLTIQIGASHAVYPTDDTSRASAMRGMKALQEVCEEAEKSNPPPDKFSDMVDAAIDVAKSTDSITRCAVGIAKSAVDKKEIIPAIVACGEAVASVQEMIDAARAADRARREQAERDARARECRVREQERQDRIRDSIEHNDRYGRVA